MQAIISIRDYKALVKALVKQGFKERNFIKGILRKFRLVKEKDMSKKTVRLNSIVEVWNSILKKIMKIRIVLPSLANLKEGYVSIFSPISLALIGRQENDTIEMNSPGLKKELMILKVIN